MARDWGKVEEMPGAKHIKRFWDKVDRRGGHECWEWLGRLDGKPNQDGKQYGFFNIFSKQYRAHRVAYFLTHGDFSDKPVIRHTCDNPTCVNPYHLIAGTYKENRKDIDDRGRGNYHHGESNPANKLSTDEVGAIHDRLNAGESIRSIADDFPCSRETVRLIKNGTLWSEVTGRGALITE